MTQSSDVHDFLQCPVAPHVEHATFPAQQDDAERAEALAEPLPWDVMLEVLVLADKYRLQGVLQKCENLIVSSACQHLATSLGYFLPEEGTNIMVNPPELCWTDSPAECKSSAKVGLKLLSLLQCLRMKNAYNLMFVLFTRQLQQELRQDNPQLDSATRIASNSRHQFLLNPGLQMEQADLSRAVAVDLIRCERRCSKGPVEKHAM